MIDLNAITNPRASGRTLLFTNTRPVADAVAKGLQTALPVKPVAPGAPASGDLTAVLKAMTDGFNQAAAAIRAQVQKAAPTSRPAAAPTSTPVTTNTPLVSAEKRARTAEIAGQVQKAPERATKVLSVSGNAPSLPLETEAQRRRSRDDAVAAQRAAEKADTDRVLVSKSGAKVLTLRALDPSLSTNALHALTHIIGKWSEAGRRPVRVRASGVSDGTGMTLTNAQAALDELEAKNAVIASVNSAGIRLIQPGLGVSRVADGAQS